MNYHIMVQDKFIDSFIDDIYLIGEQNNNVFLIRGAKGDTDYIKTDKLVTYINADKDLWKQKVISFQKSDNVIVHWYDMWIGSVLYDIPNTIAVFHWGGDFFEDPFWYHAKWLFDKDTYKYVKQNKDYPSLKFKSEQRFLDSVKDLIYFKINQKKKYIKKHRYVERIDYIILTQQSTGDLKKTKKLYPRFVAKSIPGFYNVNFNLASRIENKHRDEKDVIRILVGNSATMTNNHLEAFKLLRGMRNIQVYCPLSYGNRTYREYIMKKGKSLFKQNFIPLTDFMKRDEYVSFINSMDVVFMFHNRSQAWGNIATALSLGKPVFLKKKNSLCEFIRNIGIKVYDAKKRNRQEILDIITESSTMRQENYDILKRVVSEEIRLSNLTDLMNTLSNKKN